MLAMYAWYMLRNMSRYTYVPPPPTPSTVSVPLGPNVTEESVNFEGLVTWTPKRILGKLERAQRRGNRGSSMLYEQLKIWLQKCIGSIHDASV